MLGNRFQSQKGKRHVGKESDYCGQILQNKRDAVSGVPMCKVVGADELTICQLGQRRFAVRRTQGNEIILSRGQSVVLRLEPYELGLQIPDAPLKTSHLRDHPGVGTADVAE
jgi:hypothetical protein